MQANQEQRIRQRAHQIWEREGRPDGADKRHWEQAMREIEEEEEIAGTAERYINEAQHPTAAPKRPIPRKAPQKKQAR